MEASRKATSAVDSGFGQGARLVVIAPDHRAKRLPLARPPKNGL